MNLENKSNKELFEMYREYTTLHGLREDAPEEAKEAQKEARKRGQYKIELLKKGILIDNITM